MASKFILTLALASQVASHGFVKTIIADGTTYRGYDPSFQWAYPGPPEVPGWSDPQNIANGFINDYNSPDLACHLGAFPGKAYATVRAGGTIQLEWTPWPDSHKGPVLDYLAACNGECTTVDKTKLLWNKIAESGMLDSSTIPAKFAADVLYQAGSKWSITIPPSIAPGNYVLRHEIIALHEGGRPGGAQNYPQCINIKVTGSGTNDLVSTGTLYNKLYTSSDPGILCNIYQKLNSYVIPGPPLLGSGGGGGGSSTSVAGTTTRTATTSTGSVGATTTTPSTLQTSTRATTTVPDVSTTTRSAAGETGTFFLPGSGGKTRKFVCYEEL